MYSLTILSAILRRRFGMQSFPPGADACLPLFILMSETSRSLHSPCGTKSDSVNRLRQALHVGCHGLHAVRSVGGYELYDGASIE